MKRVLCVGFVVLLGVGAVACSDDGGSSSGSDDTTTDDSSSASNTELLGEKNPATGTPVKVGLLTNGGDCPNCSTGDDEPVAEATVQWINDYLGGVGGHPIELVVCVDDIEPSKAVDCANELISAGVSAVVIGTSGTTESSWPVLHDAGIPTINYSTTVQGVLEDDENTFVLQDPQASVLELPIGVAEEVGAEKVTNLVIDVPAATDIYESDIGPAAFEDADLEYEVVPVPLGATDMTPQAQQIVSDNPDGLVAIIGHDLFCIPALQGLTAAGFEGTITTIQFCVTDAMREAIPDDVKEGIVIAADGPIDDDTNESWLQYNAVLDEYDAPDSIAREDGSSLAIYSVLGALSVGTQQLEGDATPESVTAAIKTMPNSVLPGSGGRHFKCDGKASTTGPAVCSASVLSAELDAEGFPTNYQVINDAPDETED